MDDAQYSGSLDAQSPEPANELEDESLIWMLKHQERPQAIAPRLQRPEETVKIQMGTDLPNRSSMANAEVQSGSSDLLDIGFWMNLPDSP